MAPTGVPPEVVAALRGDVLPAVIGVLVTAAGLVGIALALLRRRPADRTTLYFALFSLGYGIRLLGSRYAAELLFGLPPRLWDYLEQDLSYLIPVPFFLFLERLRGPGWRSSIRRLWQAFLLYALLAIPWEILRRAPESANGPYRGLVIAAMVVTLAQFFRPGEALTSDLRRLRVGFLVLAGFALVENLRGIGVFPWPQQMEAVGMLFLLGTLGSVVARRFFDDRTSLAEIQGELAAARRIQESILPRELPRLPGLAIAVRYVSASDVAGDLYDFLPGPPTERRLGVLVADVSGHGVPAALIASMVKVAAAAQAPHAASPARVLTEMNRTFYGLLQKQFVTAACLAIDLETRRLTWASAGHPPPLLARRGGTGEPGEVRELAGGGIVLGRLSRAAYGEASVDLQAGDRIVVFTDGLTEGRNPEGEPFGDERLQAFVAEQAGVAAEPFAAALLARAAEWGGGGEGFEDDVTLVVVDVVSDPGDGAWRGSPGRCPPRHAYGNLRLPGERGAPGAHRPGELAPLGQNRPAESE